MQRPPGNVFPLQVLSEAATLEIAVVPQASLIDVFNAFKNASGLDIDPSNHVFFNSKIQEINNTPVSNLLQSRELFLVVLPRDQAQQLQNFINSFATPLLAEMVLLHPRALSLAQGITSNHLIIDRLHQPDVFAKVMSVIPEQIFNITDPDEKLIEVTRWFNQDFLKFVKDELDCKFCQGKCKKQKAFPPTFTEKFNGANRAEFFKCPNCGAGRRFPRYEYVEPILVSKIGRCGEFVTAFTSILYVLGFDVRSTYDPSDHTWVEVWSESKQRYVAVDPCENTIDAPLMYEEGWGKKLEWVIAIGEYSVVDVTKKYTLHANELSTRRSQSLNETRNFPPGMLEDDVSKVLKFRNQCYQSKLSQETKAEIDRKIQLDLNSINQQNSNVKAEEQRPRISGGTQ